MKKNNVSQYALIKHHGIEPSPITRLTRNKSVSIHTIERLFRILYCRVTDIMEYIEPDA